jgi:DNA-binding transcriptional MerR regulator
MPTTLNIGELARVTGTNVETIRYYERIGLLPGPPRTASNYRVYSAGHVGRLSFTRRARSRACRPLSQMTEAARCMAARKLRLVLS